MVSRADFGIACLPLHNGAGSVKVLNIATMKAITRDHVQILPMPTSVADYITTLALSEGFTRSGFLAEMAPSALTIEDAEEAAVDDIVAEGRLPPLTEMIPIDGRDDIVLPGAAHSVAPGAGVTADAAVNADEDWGPAAAAYVPPRRSSRLQHLPAARLQIGERDRSEDNQLLSLRKLHDDDRSALRRQLHHRRHWHDRTALLNVSVKAAIRERGEEARTVITAELAQMIDKNVWHGVHLKGLTKEERRAVLRSKMFLKDKFTASGAWERYKARLVASGDMQDKTLYDNLSSPTAATTSVLIIAAIAAAERRQAMVIDIGGAFLNASLAPTGVVVHMRLDKVLTAMLVQLDTSYERFVEKDGCCYVQLDQALYGVVEAAGLWYRDLKSKLEEDGFKANPYDMCVFNKDGRDGKQVTVVMHVDDLFITCETASTLDEVHRLLKKSYPETRMSTGDVLDYVGMTFDFREDGQVRITMEGCINDILDSCGEKNPKVTPATSTLFDVREVERASVEEAKYFHSHVMKLLYLAKRVRPEILTAVSFLTTRVQTCDIDDMAKLDRVLGYLSHSSGRGIVLRIGESLTVSAFIDASYGVHTTSGKSHTGCAIVLGEAGPVFAKSIKQKIVTKSSTEAELVGLSDSASQAILIRNFVIAQGYDIGPVVIYQDNKSCIALIKRGGPTSTGSRHINIRHFWLSERQAEGEVVLEYLTTEEMHPNMLTKPVQGAQFLKERQGLTNWE
jgi:hypothetical protein